MDDLFNKLKAEPSIPKYENANTTKDCEKSENITNGESLSSMPPSTSSVVTETPKKSRSISPQHITPKIIDKNKTDEICQSMAPPTTSTVLKAPLKCDSISLESNGNSKKVTKECKVLLKRYGTKQENAVTEKKETSLSNNNEANTQLKQNISNSPNGSRKLVQMKKPTTPKKLPLTKAQRKFMGDNLLKDKPKVRRVAVRIKRMDFDKYLGKAKLTESKKELNKSPLKKKTERTTKRPSDDGEPKTKKRKKHFFIKLSSPKDDEDENASQQQNQPSELPSTKNSVKSDKTKTKMPSMKRKNEKRRISSVKTTTKPTKFRRSELIKKFGKRFFKSYIRIERCKHPLMLSYESNARARKLEGKRQSTRNLSVSFKEQVEIIGDSEYDSDDNEQTDEMPFSTLLATPLQAMIDSTISNVVTSPISSNNVENGNVEDKVEQPNTSTPCTLTQSKKGVQKSYSPLKDDETPSPRKEQLKLGDEKWRVNVDVTDNGDDDYEYIVPNEIPERHTSTMNIMENAKVTADLEEPQLKSNAIENKQSNGHSESDDSFASAEENVNNAKANCNDKNNIDDKKNNHSLVAATDAINAENVIVNATEQTQTIEASNNDKIPIEVGNVFEFEAIGDIFHKLVTELKTTCPENKENNTANNSPLPIVTLVEEDNVALQLYVEDENEINRNATQLTDDNVKDSNVEDSVVNDTNCKLSKTDENTKENMVENNTGTNEPMSNIVLEINPTEG